MSYSTDRRLYGGGECEGEEEAGRIGERPSNSAVRRRIGGGMVRPLATSNTARRLYGSSICAEVELAGEEQAITIKVLVVDDHPIVRDGLHAFLGSQKDIQVVGEAADGEEALDMVFRLTPDVVLMDLLMPRMSGLEATRRIVAAGALARVLILSQYDDYENATACRQAGAWGFVPKRNATSDLLDGIRTVSRGKPYTATTLIGAS